MLPERSLLRIAARFCFIFLATLSFFAFARPALAQPSSGDKETARAAMKEGDEKFAAKDFATAAKSYEVADSIMHVPVTGLALAKAYVELGKLVEARDVLLDVGRRPKDASEAPGSLYASARNDAAQLATKLADRIPSIVITVEGPPNAGDASVTIDGEAIPPSTLGVARKVNPGAHTIVASAQGFAQSSTSITVKESEEQKVPIKLSPSGGTTPAAGATQVHVVSPDKPGNVTVDGRAVGVTPLDVPVSAGAHKVEIDYPGGAHDDRSVDVTAGQTVELNFHPTQLDELARARRGVHVGFSIAPAMLISPDLGSPFYGGNAAFVFHVGITPVFEFRTGVTTGFLYRGNAGGSALEFNAVIPLTLHINLNQWFSMWAGLTGGFALVKPDGGDLAIAPAIGPDWSLLTMTGGDKRQFEVSFAQGFRFFGNPLPFDYHQSVVFTMLFLN
jgi:hypothetical protein